MKIKKENIEKLILTILTFLLIIYIGVGLIIFSFFNISERFFNKDNVYDFVNKIDIVSILKSELGSELSELNFIENELEEMGLTDAKINELVKSEEAQQLSGRIITNMFNKIAKDSNIEYRVTNEQINELVEANINKVSSNIDKEQLLNVIEEKVPSIVLNINTLLDKVYEKIMSSVTIQKYQNYMYASINVLGFIYNDFVKYFILFIIISFICLLLFIKKDIYKSLKCLSASFFIPFISFILIRSFVLNSININNALINGICSIIDNELMKHSAIYFAISLSFVVIYLIIYEIKKRKEGVCNE